MPNQFYCSKCGTELIYSRKAVPGKGKIFDLIDPHECKGYAINANKLNKPTVLDILDNLKDLGKIIDEATGERHVGLHTEPGDKRNDKASSTSPHGLSDIIKNMSPSEDDVE